MLDSGLCSRLSHHSPPKIQKKKYLKKLSASTTKLLNNAL